MQLNIYINSQAARDFALLPVSCAPSIAVHFVFLPANLCSSVTETLSHSSIQCSHFRNGIDGNLAAYFIMLY